MPVHAVNSDLMENVGDIILAYRWRATYSFDYPLLDLPVDIGDIRLYPAPPELDRIPRAIHCYEFDTFALDRDAQQEAEKMYLARLEQLGELSAFAPYYTEVSFHSLVLLDGGGLKRVSPEWGKFQV